MTRRSRARGRRAVSYPRSAMIVVIAAAAVAPITPAHAQVGPITGASFFDGLRDTTIVGFENDGAGSPLTLIEGETLALPAGEYAPFGFNFDQDIAWVNDGNPSFNSAQLLSAVEPHSIPSSQVSTFSILFSTEVRSVAFWIANNFEVDSDGPVLSAYDGMDQLITSVTFGSQTSGSIFIDDRIGIADFGVMGIFSETPIARLEISKDAAILDDLTFSSAIPSPGAALLGTIALGVGVARRRR